MLTPIGALTQTTIMKRSLSALAMLLFFTGLTACSTTSASTTDDTMDKKGSAMKKMNSKSKDESK